jgi:hypothetical protein
LAREAVTGSLVSVVAERAFPLTVAAPFVSLPVRRWVMMQWLYRFSGLERAKDESSMSRRGWTGKQRRVRVTAAAVLLATALALSGCSRTGALSGDVAVRIASGEVTRGARMSVYLIVPSEAFEREWAEVIAAFRQEVAPAVEVQKGTEHRAEEARLKWDRAVAARGKDGTRRGQWTLALRDSNVAGSQGLWRNVRATEGVAFQAKKRVWEIVRKHEGQADAVLTKHATERVQTDETGHYVIVKVPAGKVYLYARLLEKKEDFVWFVPIEVQTGTQRADLTGDNQRNWPIVP